MEEKTAVIESVIHCSLVLKLTKPIINFVLESNLIHANSINLLLIGLKHDWH